MDIEFDPDKDAANIAKHGVSLAGAAEFDLASAVIMIDDRYAYGELRYRAFGELEGAAHCLVFTVRDEVVRVISLRRAHQKEIDRYR